MLIHMPCTPVLSHTALLIANQLQFCILSMHKSVNQSLPPPILSSSKQILAFQILFQLPKPCPHLLLDVADTL